MSNDSNVAPEWAPPAHLSDPLVRRKPMKRAEWSRASRGRIPGPRNQAVAARLADYGNRDGTRCHPGVARLVRDTCSSDKTVRRALAWLAEAGWITLTERGNRRLGMADTYRLSIAAPLAAQLGLWSGGAQWQERPLSEPLRPDVGPGSVCPQSPVTVPRSEVISTLLEVTDDLPPGPTHQGLSTPRRDSITGSRASASASDDDEDLAERIATELGVELGPDVESTVLGMQASGAHPIAIRNTALKMIRGVS